MTTVKLGEVCDIVVGRTPPRADPSMWGGDSPWVSIADMNQGLRINSTKEGISAAGAAKGKLLEAGTVLLSFKLSIGKVARASMPLYTNEAIAGLPIKNPTKLDAAYLLRALQAQDLTGGSNRAAMGATLNKAALQAITVPLPPLEEQRRIAAILDQADAIRSKRRQVLTQLDALPERLFTELFGGQRDHEVEALGDLVSLRSGGTPPKGQPELWSGSVPWFSPKDFKAAYLVDSVDHLDETSPAVVKLGTVPADTVALVVRGMILAHTAPVCLLRSSASINQDVRALLPKRELDPFYLLWALRSASDRLLTLVSSAAHGTKRIETRDLLNFKIPVASLTEQAEFRELIDSCERQRQTALKALSQDDELFASLQSRAFRGEL